MKATVEWTDNLNFEGKTDFGAVVPMGPSPRPGETAEAAAPMDMVLLALGGCTAMDIVWILNKKKITFDKFWVELETERVNEHPKVFSKIHMKFILVGDVPIKAAEQAAKLSHEKYCSVGAMLGVGMDITQEVEVRES